MTTRFSVGELARLKQAVFPMCYFAATFSVCRVVFARPTVRLSLLLFRSCFAEKCSSAARRGNFVRAVVNYICQHCSCGMSTYCFPPERRVWHLLVWFMTAALGISLQYGACCQYLLAFVDCVSDLQSHLSRSRLLCRLAVFITASSSLVSCACRRIGYMQSSCVWAKGRCLRKPSFPIYCQLDSTVAAVICYAFYLRSSTFGPTAITHTVFLVC